jgi:restriction system protein
MRRTNGEKVFDDVFDTFLEIATKLPWYVDIILATLFYFLFHFLSLKYPMIGFATPWLFLLGLIIFIFQYLFPSVFIMGGIASAWHTFKVKMRGKDLLKNATTNKAAEIVSKMNWLEFEILIGEWFKTQGYEVTQAGGADTGKAHADGGIDIELHKDNQLFLVQCKHYRSWSVPVETIRDLMGVMATRGAAGGFVVTSGHFTEPAKEFAMGRIELIDGAKLMQILQNVNTNNTETKTESKNPTCPVCSSPMVLRTAHHGENAGNEFWGCSQYPECKGIVSI